MSNCEKLYYYSTKIKINNYIYSGLGLIVVGYDLVFLLQHYIWYPNHQTAVFPFKQDDRKRRVLAKGGGANKSTSSGGSPFPPPLLNSKRRPINANKSYGSTCTSPYSSSV
jgi:hypothetical protein